MNLFLFYKNVLSCLHPVAFFSQYFYFNPPDVLTHLYKLVICSFTKRGYKIVTKRDSSAKEFLEVKQRKRTLSAKRLRQTPFFRSRLRPSLVIVFFTKIEDHNYVL